ncbi:MAG TPA: lactate racemase domain-containing protein [Anaerolineae bacterium]|nr:lactate racemase domain-containing protein [Anaerolineae bacterium]
MAIAQAIAESGLLTHDAVLRALTDGLGGRFAGQKVLVLIPDHTRSSPLPELFRMLVEVLHDARALNFMVALGTHPGYSEEGLNHLVGITAEERATTYKRVGLLNHAWDDPSALVSLGVMDQDEIKHLAGTSYHCSLPAEINIRINKAVLEHDHILILGPTFPHEVVGFSGGAKYFFPGISGPDVINATHWLGALATVLGTIGIKDTPVRAVIHAAAHRLKTPVTLAALIVAGHDLSGLLIGDVYETWSAAADVSSQRHIKWCDHAYKSVLSTCPPMYDELWTAGKCMYKLEPVVEVGGELIIYAPHLDVVSPVHGKYIYEAGYHILPYFLADWEKYKHLPLGALAHCTHVRGSGVMDGAVEKPNVRLTLASMLPPEECAKLNLRYRDPATIDPADWQNREDEGILYVAKAGEMLYKVRSETR